MDLLRSSTVKDADEKKIKRVVPKASNKIIDQAVARLYVAYPDKNKWTYTGLAGALCLVNDLVGNTFYLKLVDIVGNEGVLWDQELYVDFQYNQDRTFFHSFELEDCLAGVLFEDKGEAAHFLKRVQQRHKHASKATLANKAAVPRKGGPMPNGDAPAAPGPRGDSTGAVRRRNQLKGQVYYDDEPPLEWRGLYKDLAAQGISEDMIAANTPFIKEFIRQQGGPLVGLEPPLPRKFAPKEERSQTSSEAHRVPPPPPPPPPDPSGSGDSRAPPPQVELEENPTSTSTTSIASTPEPAVPATPVQRPVPPPVAFAGTKVTATTTPAVGQRAVPPPPPPRTTGAGGVPPPPPPRTANAPTPPPPRRGAAPVAQPMPSLPSRTENGGLPPPAPILPSRDVNGRGTPATTAAAHQPQRVVSPPTAVRPPSHPNTGVPPPPPPSHPAVPTTIQSMSPPATPTPPAPAPGARPVAIRPVTAAAPSAPPRAPPVTAAPAAPPTHPMTPPVTAVPAAPPAPPRAPPVTAAPSVTATPAAPAAPPAPMPAPIAPAAPAAPPAPAPAPTAASGAPPLPQAGEEGGRSALLQSITQSSMGGLRKTDKSHLDRPSALLREVKGEASPPSTSTPDAGPAGMASALAAALSARKGKVLGSDDEEQDDDWD